jgi:hypothetical protein
MTEAATLTEARRQTHGKFSDHARCTQRLKNVIQQEMALRRMDPGPFEHPTDQHVEALDMILHKIGRIVAGDATFQDHWDDIAGYAHIANKKF